MLYAAGASYKEAASATGYGSIGVGAGFGVIDAVPRAALSPPE